MSIDNTKMIRRSVNWVVLIATLVVGLAVGAALYVVHGYRIKQTAGELLAMAEQREADSEWFKAAEYLDRYLHLKPSDARARGRMALDFGKFAQEANSWMPKQQAIDLHYRALASNDASQATELRLSLLELLLDHGRYAEVEKEAKGVLDGNPDSPPATRALAIALAAQLADGSIAATASKDMKIIKTIEKARKLNPDDTRLATILSVVLREYPLVVQAEYPGTSERERNQRADENFDEFITENAKTAAAYLARNAYRVKYGLPDAHKDLEEAIRLAPENPEVLLAAAVAAFDEARRQQLARSNEDQWKAELHKAKGFFEALVNGPPEHQIEQSYLGLGDTHFVSGDYDQALAVWQKGLQQFKQTTTLIALHSRIAESSIDRGKLDLAGESLDAIDQLLGKLGGSIRRDDKLNLTRSQDLRRASWLIKRQNVADAIPLLRQVATSQPKGEKNVQPTVRAWMHLGTINASQGEWMDAASAFDQAGLLDPSMAQPRLAASTSWLYAGRADLASERAEQALQHTSAPEAWLALALAQVQLQSQLPVQQRSWQRLEKALNVLESSKEQLAEPWRISFVRVEQVVSKAKGANDPQLGKEEVQKILQAAEQRYGNSRAFWSQLCIVYQTVGLPSDAQRALAEVRKSGESPSEAVLLDARLASLSGDPAKAQAILQAGLKSVAPQFEQRMREELLNATIAAKDASHARNLLVSENQRNPQNIGVLRKLAELDLEQKNLNAVRQWEAKLQAAGQLGEPYARYFRAWRMYLSSTGEKDPQLHDALRELEQVLLARANWAEASTLKGAVEQRLGRKEQAAAAYERAIQLGERRLHVYEQLIVLLDDLKRPADVDRYLARLETAIPLSQRLAEMAMNAQIRRERPEQALEIAKARAAQRPDDAVAQLWLGRLLVISNKLAEAEVPLKRATELAPKDPRHWNALVDCYIRLADRRKLEAVIEQLAAETVLDGVQRSTMLARCFESLGNRAEAERHYAMASEAAPADVALHLRIAQYYLQSNPQQAKSHLEEALKLEPTSVAGKQMLAIVHAALGEMNEAASLLSVANDSGLVAADDIRLNALLLLQRGGEGNLTLAAEKLEELLKREAGNTKEQFTDRLLLARLYEQQARLAADSKKRAERLAATEEQLRGMAQHSTATPLQQAALIQFFLRYDRKQDALPWLEQMERSVEGMPKDDPAVMQLMGQLWIQQGTPDRTAKWVTKMEKVDSMRLRALALKAQAKYATDATADIAAIVEQPADQLFQAAKPGDEQRQIAGTIGDLYTSLKRDQDAERWYQRLREQDEARYMPLVRSLQKQGKIPDAIAICDTARKSDDSVQPYLVLANLLIEGKPTAADFAAAEGMFADALKKYESDPRLLYALGLVRVMQKRDAESIALFRKVVAASPRSVPALNNLAMLLADIPLERPEALKLIDQAIDFAGEDASLLDTKGAILLYSGRSGEAVPILELATREPTADPRHHFHLALAYRDQGKLEDAKKQLQTALDRELASQVLTNTDQQLLAELRTALKM